VLVFKENDTAPLYVLDNQVPELLPGPERHALTAIYIFQNGDKKRYVKNEFKGKKFEKWISAK
jgi:hypothetical protein